jgi:hypothetical protein
MLFMATPAMEADINGILGGILGGVIGGAMSTANQGKVVKQTRTDGSGKLRFEGLAPGDYTLVVDCQSLTAAIEKGAPAKKIGGLSFNIVGGSFRGRSSATVAGISSYCHGSAGQSIPVGFSIPKGAGSVSVSLAFVPLS